MKLRWLIFFLLFCGLGVILMRVASPEYDYASSPVPDVANAPLPSPETQSPIEGGGGGVTEPPGLSQEDVTSAEYAINRALTQLPQGQVYHNVPEEMQVGVSETIEAGITPEVTDKIREELQGRGNIEIESEVRFDPSGVKMELIAQPDEFEIFEVKGGEQFVTANTAGKWIWRVTPLKSGDNLIRVKAIINLNVPELNITRPVEIEVFNATREVQVNLGYSISQFAYNNWKEGLSLIVGSGSLASLVTWWIGRKDKRKSEEVKG